MAPLQRIAARDASGILHSPGERLCGIVHLLDATPPRTRRPALADPGAGPVGPTLDPAGAAARSAAAPRGARGAVAARGGRALAARAGGAERREPALPRA